MSKLGHLALVGPMGAGKTTLAEALATEEGHRVLPLGAPIKEVAVALLGRPLDKGLDRSLLQRLAMAARDPAWAKLDTPHRPAQEAGLLALMARLMPEAGPQALEALREALYGAKRLSVGWGHPDYWTRRWEAAFRRAPGSVVVDDLRFPAEAEALRRLGFSVVRVRAELSLRQARVMARDGRWDEAWSKDPTEAWADDVVSEVEVDAQLPPAALVAALRAWRQGQLAQ